MVSRNEPLDAPWRGIAHARFAERGIAETGLRSWVGTVIYYA